MQVIYKNLIIYQFFLRKISNIDINTCVLNTDVIKFIFFKFHFFPQNVVDFHTSYHALKRVCSVSSTERVPLMLKC